MTPVPTLDLRPPPDAAARATLTRQLDDAMRRLGAFVATGLELDPAIAADALDAARRLHARPAAEKRALHAEGRIRRYSDYESDDDAPDALRHAALTTMFGPSPEALAGTVTEGQNRWPAGDPAVRASVEAFDRAMVPIARRVTGLMAEALGLAPAALLDHFGEPTRYVRLHVYPPRPDDVVGCVAHTDHGFITFILEDAVGGLDVEWPDGAWATITPRPGAMAVIAGDVFARWTNGRWRAPRHRARHPEAEVRYSAPFFFDPAWEASIECLPTCTSPDAPAAFAPARYRDLVLARWGDYGAK